MQTGIDGGEFLGTLQVNLPDFPILVPVMDLA